MKRIKATKTNIEKLHHPIGKTPDKHFASNCSGLCVIVQPEPSSVKSYYGHWSKIILQPDGKQKIERFQRQIRYGAFHSKNPNVFKELKDFLMNLKKDGWSYKWLDDWDNEDSSPFYTGRHRLNS